MDNPPPYEESKSSESRYYGNQVDAKGVQHFSIREEVGASRSQHVAAIVAKLLPQIRDRAKQGLSKSILLLLPSNQDCSRKGQLVGYPEDELPILIQLEGRQDTLEFWTQSEAIDELQRQMLAALSENVPQSKIEPEPSIPGPVAKSSFFTRKSSKAPPKAPASVPPPSVTVVVELDEVHFRSESEYGLYETLRGRGVVLTVVVR